MTTSPADPAAAPAPPPADATPAVEMRQVRAGYGRIEVLHGVDLEVPRGSVYALLGPNGAGKSTLLKAVGGRLELMGGSIRVAGRDIGRSGADALARRGVCSIPEGRGIFPNLTVRENLLMWTYRGSVSMAQVEQRTFERFPKLADRRKQLAGTLSGGEQQMLAFARALAGDPEVLVLDEISMGLAPLVVADLYEVVAQLRAEGITILLAEQFVHTALGVATHAALVVHGRVERSGTPGEIAAEAAGSYLSSAGPP